MSSFTRTSSGAVLVLTALAFTAGGAIAAEKAQMGKRDAVRPFPPSYISLAEGHKQVKVEDWKDPRLCGQCHTQAEYFANPL